MDDVGNGVMGPLKDGVVLQIFNDNFSRAMVSAEPLTIDNETDVLGGLVVDGVEFNPIGSGIDHADSMYF
eukprot:1832175-Ditylum_brightwellii.AAC.1